MTTATFEVYAPQLFPGAGEETALAKSFWMQGVRTSGRSYTGTQFKNLE